MESRAGADRREDLSGKHGLGSRVTEASTTADYTGARVLIREYVAGLEVRLDAAALAEELDTLPELYGPPKGCLLLVVEGRRLVGCVCLRRLEDEIGEIKRLYARPAARGGGIGRRLMEAALEAAVRIGYRAIRLDTLPSMKAARALYESLGFHVISEYAEHCCTNAVCYELDLSGRMDDAR